MSDMIERVARAIVERLKADASRLQAFDGLDFERTPEYPTDAHMPPSSNGTYDGLLDAHALARAAIEAMREPTPEMTSGDDVKASWKGCTVCIGLPDGWRAMIDAALKSSERPQT